ncbi:MAG TPA: DUF2141 domain-containing protein [Tepidisphaeraceae bacterium]|jgi:uncharacterized protein (DUF2141 family)|nr:DUF2141 domain-containing protein [Tepidisphaeraceae bacterium]
MRRRTAKLIVLALLLSLMTPLGSTRAQDAPEGEKANLAVAVTDLKNTRGMLRLGVFDQANGFPRDRGAALLWQSLPADAENPTFHIDLPPGRYAAVVLHDENSNEKLDTNFIGIPTEGHGVTNNPKPRRRPPRYDEAVFELKSDGATMSISVQYKYL